MSVDPATVAAGLSEAQRRDIVAFGDARNPFGGLFDALSADDLIALKGARIVRCYVPAGCYAPLTKLTPLGEAVRHHLLGDKNDAE